MIVRTDAVVLRAFDYRETSTIATLFTRRDGVISVLARGARRPKSRFGATLQPMSYIQIVYYVKEGRTLQTLTEAAHVHRFPDLTANIDRVTAGLRMVELVRAMLHEGDSQPMVLKLLVQSLTWLNHAEDRIANALPWFQLRLATLLGFAPDVQKDDLDALNDDGGCLLLDTGGAASSSGGKNSVKASRAALRAFAVFARTELDTAGRMDLGDGCRHEVEAMVDAYLRYHVEGKYPDRVHKVAVQLERGLARIAE
ncbi:MAG: DNA repair protein RecO [Bacteroidetes bacterium]|nr:DNA repair protein RecO [Bacteroidota bacterium]